MRLGLATLWYLSTPQMIIWVIDQAWGEDGWILAKFSFCVFMNQGGVDIHKLAKKRTRPISSHLDRKSLINKGFIIWLSGKFFSRDTAASSLERARLLHLARSGSQSQRPIWFILPAHGASHIITTVIVPLTFEQLEHNHNQCNRK